MTEFEQAKKLLEHIKSAGYNGYLVGGCVRDMSLNLTPKDYDIATSADPAQVKEVLKEYEIIDTGIQHGTVTVVTEKGNFEITTYRVESGYSDFRHPDNLEFVDNIDLDLGRRDFTINALAMDLDGNIRDPYNGLQDLEKHTIRCVGTANRRFHEDPLRMMRAIRFSAKLGFNIEEKTYSAIIENAQLITKISQERIRDELCQILYYDPEKIDDLQATGLLKYILPEVDGLINVSQKNKWHYTDVYHHTLDALKYTKKYKQTSKEKLLYIRLSLLLHDTGKAASKTVDSEGWEHFYGHPEVSYEIALKILNRLKFSNNDIESISKLVRYHDELMHPTRKMLFKVINDFQLSLYEFNLLGFIKEADISAHIQKENDDRMKRYFKLLNMYKQKAKTDKLFSMDQLAIGGKEIIEIYSIKPSKLVGEIKQDLFKMCFTKPSLNNAEYLKQYLINNKEKYIHEGE